jgi:hypothetical protein
MVSPGRFFYEITWQPNLSCQVQEINAKEPGEVA